MRLAEARVTRVAACVASACLLAAAAACGYFRIFSQFALYDDEGYILQTVRSYLQGARLYDEVFTQYGPAFYVLESLIHRTLRVPLTHDFERFITVAIWVTASACCGATVLRLSRSWLAAGWTFVGVFINLTPIINEPAHPQGPLVLVISVVVLLSTWIDGDSASSRASYQRTAIAGMLTGFALLVKVNVGAFIAIGFGLPLLLSARMPRLLRAGAVAIAAGACLLPLVVTKNHLDTWAFTYGVGVSLSLAATIVTIARSPRRSLPMPLVGLYAAAAGVAAVLLLLPILLRGTTISALVLGTIVRPSQFADLFSLAFIWPKGAVVEAAASLAVAVLCSIWIGWRGRLSPLLVAAAKLSIAGVCFWLPHTGYGSLISYFAPLVWISMVPSRSDESDRQHFGKQVLAVSAVMQTLQSYPVAGSQVAFASFLMIPVGFIAARDALATLEEYAGRPAILNFAVQLSLAGFGFWLYNPLLSLEPWRIAHSVRYELRLQGAEHLHLAPDEVAGYQWLTANIRSGCGSLLTLPGMYSLNAWSGVAPPNHLNVTAWTTLLSDREQAAIWQSVDASHDACAVENSKLAVNWLGGRTLESLPAVGALHSRFTEAGSAGNYTLLRRTGDVRLGTLTWLFDGRQEFERGRTPLPVVSTFLQQPTTTTVRLWLRTRNTGVVVGCQSAEHAGLPSRRWLPMFYVSNSGRLYGQHWTPTLSVQATNRPMNDGAWHHAALVRQGQDERFYVDGGAVGARTAPIETDDLAWCQVGTGATSLWPDTQRRWTPFKGEVEGLGVASNAWTPEEVKADWERTRPRD